MKLSTILFTGVGVLTIGALFSANVAIKQKYDRTAKNDPYWEYGKILEQPFSHINIDGGNFTQISFEEAESSCVRVLRQWPGFESGAVKAFVRADTLYVSLPKHMAFDNDKLRSWFKHTTLVRLFAPHLHSARGVDTDLDLLGLRQQRVSVDLAGNSTMEIESSVTQIDSLRVLEVDSSSLRLETSPDISPTNALYINGADIRLRGTSKLDLGNAHVGSLKIGVENDALINLSGFAINRVVH